MDPQDIDNIEFKTTRLKGGYDPDEVDNFLDRVSNSLRTTNEVKGQLEAENARLRRQVTEANIKLANYSDLPTTQIPMQATGILEAAQRVAEDVKAQAEGAAATVVANAQAEANTVRLEQTRATNEHNGRIAALKDKHEGLRSFLAQFAQSGLDELEANRDG